MIDEQLTDGRTGPGAPRVGPWSPWNGLTAEPLPAPDAPVSDGGDAGVVLDEQARKAYRRRLDDIEEDIEEATGTNDPERPALAHVERDSLARGSRGLLRQEHARYFDCRHEFQEAGSAMEKARRGYSHQFRREAVRRVRSTDEPLARIALDLNVSSQTLRKWVRHADLTAELALREERLSQEPRT